MGVAVEVPVMWENTATGTTVFGSGDTELTAGANVIYRERFRTGFAGQVIFQTASEQALGGGSTKLKGSWGLTWVLTKRLEFTGAFSYKQTIHIVRGGPTKQFEPDVTMNLRVLHTTWFVESDSYYDFIPEQFAPMIKTGLSRSWGETKSWTASPYIEWSLNSYARMTQHHLDVGLDVTWYPFRGH